MLSQSALAHGHIVLEDEKRQLWFFMVSTICTDLKKCHEIFISSLMSFHVEKRGRQRCR